MTGGRARRCLILVNREAGARRAGLRVQELRALVRDGTLAADVRATTSAAELRDAVRAEVAARAPVVAVAGGDGTVSSAVQEVARSETALGITAEPGALKVVVGAA